MLPSRDPELVQILDTALAEATARAHREDGSSWLACRPGCASCCHGVFRISMLDAERLRTGLRTLAAQAPAQAAVIQQLALALAKELSPLFAGNAATGVLSNDEEAWEGFADLPQTDAACPVLDPQTGRCQLYTSRPATCRVFGPPVLNEGGLGMCELCYVGATEPDILHGEMFLTHHELEEELGSELPSGETVITWALLA